LGHKQEMTGKDRTNEFRAVAEGLAKRNPFVPKPQTKKALINNTISSNKLAAEIGREISQTAEKMQELTKLARTSTPFGDPVQKIDDLTVDIQDDISKLQSKLETLGQIVQTQKSQNKSTSEHSTTILTALNSNLMSTTKQFADALELRTQTLKTQQERRQKVTGAIFSPSTPMFQPVAFDMFNEDGGFAGADGDDVVIQVPLMESYDESFLLQRVDRVKEIEGEMHKIHKIFTKLAEYVQAQGEQIRRIEDRMDETIEHSEHAHQQIITAYNNLSDSRRMMLKGFGIVLFFIFIWAMFFA